MSSQKTIRRSVSKTIPATAEKVFDHWLIPTFVGNWMFGPHLDDEKIIELSNEVRPRGEFSYTVKRGGKEIIHNGVFIKIDRPRCLEFSWQQSDKDDAVSQVQVQFEEDGERTRLKVSLRLDPLLADDADAIKELWSRRCKALSTLLSK